MREWCGSLLLGLLVIFWLQSCAKGQNGKGPDQCCFSYYSRRIPQGRIVRYTETRSDCPKPGVILTTLRGNRVCVDPRESWVQNATEVIDLRVV